MEYLREFWRGLTTTTAASWLGVVALCAIEIVASCVLLRPRYLATVKPTYLMETSGDDYCKLSFKLFRLRHSRSRALQVSYLGASQAIRSLAVRDDVALSRELSQEVGVPARFHMLTSNNQRYEDSLAVTDQLPRGYRGVVMLGVNDYKNDYKVKNPARFQMFHDRIALESAPSLLTIPKAQMQQMPTTGIFFLDHLGFFSAHRIAALRFGRAPQSVGDENARVHRVGKRLAALQDDSLDDEPERTARAPILTSNLPVIERLVNNMNARHIAVVFLENPEAPARNHKFGERIDRFRIEFAEYADSRGCSFWDFNPRLSLEQSDFQDEVHLGSHRVREEYQRLMMTHLAELLREKFLDAPEESDEDEGQRDDGGGDDAPPKLH